MPYDEVYDLFLSSNKQVAPLTCRKELDHKIVVMGHKREGVWPIHTTASSPGKNRRVYVQGCGFDAALLDSCHTFHVYIPTLLHLNPTMEFGCTLKNKNASLSMPLLSARLGVGGSIHHFSFTHHVTLMENVHAKINSYSYQKRCQDPMYDVMSLLRFIAIYSPPASRLVKRLVESSSVD